MDAAATAVQPSAPPVLAHAAPEVLGLPELRLSPGAMLALLGFACEPETPPRLRVRALAQLGRAIQPQHLSVEMKHDFVREAVKKGYVDMAVGFIETGGEELASIVCDFLGDFAFNSDAAGQAVSRVFGRIVSALTQAFGRDPCSQQSPLLRSFISLCANIVATTGVDNNHLLVSLVQSVFLPIIRNPHASDRLLGSTILLLANLSTTAEATLRESGCAEALFELVADTSVPPARKSVAESVVIFLLGHRPCEEVNHLLKLGKIEEYCLPILRCALEGRDFRGMYPHLVYSTRLFAVLALSRPYAEALAKHEEVPRLLLSATRRRDVPVCLESDDQGRRLALEALEGLCRYGLWPPAADAAAQEFVAAELPRLLRHDCAGVRAAAAALWGRLNVPSVVLLLLVGGRLSEDGRLRAQQVWREKVLGFLFPFLTTSPRD